ncbi:MAG: hypothetical protein ACOX61_03265, partial [Brooklawnia sp.]
MSNQPRRPRRRSRAEQLAEVARLLAEQPGTVAPDRLLTYLEHYFRHADNSVLLTRPSGQIAHSIRHHAQLGRRRQPGQSHLELFTPVLAEQGWDADGHTVLTLVTDDKPWLIDTVTEALNAQGWSLRELVHPQFQVLRDAEGLLVDVGTRDDERPMLAEAWVWIELYPPLGASAAESSPQLMEDLHAGLADLDAANQDAVDMRERMVATARQAAAANHPQAAVAAEMLDWLADDRVLLLGAR